MALRIMEQREDVLGFLIKNVREAIEKISNSNDDIAFNAKVNMRSEKSEKKINIGHANLGGDAHKFWESQYCWSF